MAKDHVPTSIDPQFWVMAMPMMAISSKRRRSCKVARKIKLACSSEKRCLRNTGRWDFLFLGGEHLGLKYRKIIIEGAGASLTKTKGSRCRNGVHTFHQVRNFQNAKNTRDVATMEIDIHKYEKM